MGVCLRLAVKVAIRKIVCTSAGRGGGRIGVERVMQARLNLPGKEVGVSRATGGYIYVRHARKSICIINIIRIILTQASELHSVLAIRGTAESEGISVAEWELGGIGKIFVTVEARISETLLKYGRIQVRRCLPVWWAFMGYIVVNLDVL